MEIAANCVMVAIPAKTSRRNTAVLNSVLLCDSVCRNNEQTVGAWNQVSAFKLQTQWR